MLACLIFFLAGTSVSTTTLAIQDSSPSAEVEQTEDKSFEEIILDDRVVLHRRNTASDDMSFYSKIVLPTLDGGKKYRAKITISNPYSEPIKFSTITMSCGCGKLIGNVQEIPPMGEAAFELQLDVPATLQRAAAQSVMFHSLDDPSKVVLTLRYTYEVCNVFAFTRRRLDLEIPDNKEKVNVRVPIQVIGPVTIDQLELEWSENLNCVNFSIVADVENPELHYAVIETTSDVIPKQGIMGELILRQVKTGIKSQVQISISHQELLTLRPESLRLSRDRESDSYVATAMLRIPSLRVAEERSLVELDNLTQLEMESVTSPPQVKVRIGGENASVSLKPLGKSGIYRINVHYDKKFDCFAKVGPNR